MSKTSLADLEERFGRKEAIILPWIFGLMAAILPVAVVLISGWAIELLIQTTHSSKMPAKLALGMMLEFPSQWLRLFSSPLSAMTVLIGLAVILGSLNVVLSWWIYRWSMSRAIQNEACFRKALFVKYHELAPVQGVSGQQEVQSAASNGWIPQIRDGILHWYRNLPRHPLLCVACVIPALLIHPALTVLSIVAIVLMWRVNSFLDLRSRKQRPIYFDRSQSIQRSMEELIQRGPLLAAVQPAQTNMDLFDSQLRLLNETEREIGNSYIWKRPAIALLLVPVIGAFAWIVSVRILDKLGTLNVSGAFVLTVLVAISSVSLLRTIRSLGRRHAAEVASQKVLGILDQPSPAPKIDLKNEPKSLLALSKRLSLEHVTLKDSSGNKLLEDISLDIRPGELTAILATSRQDAETLGELLLGFGVPIAGRILWDDCLSSDITPNSFHGRCLWVAADGPLLSGTVRENLTIDSRSMSDGLVDALKKSNSYEHVFELPDNIDTLISASDDRFKGDAAFRLGIARALLANPSVCVMYEPSGRVKTSKEIETLRAIQQLQSQKAAVIVLAQRASTLREADQIAVLHEHRIVAIGKHADLLESSDLYRHLNYTLFSPMRQVHIDTN